MRFEPFILLSILLASLVTLEAATNSTTPAGGKLDFSAFRVIAEKNIFNQNRYARTARTETREVRRTAPSDVLQLTGTMSYEKGDLAFFEGTRSEYRKVARVGDKLAGFSVASIGPSAVVLASPTNRIDLPVGKQLRRHEHLWEVAEQSDAIGTPASPVLAQAPPQASVTNRDNNNYQGPGPFAGFEGGPPPMPPPGEGPFPTPPTQPQDTTEGAATSATPTTPTTTETPAGNPPAEAGSEDDVLRRLIQRREQELNR